MFLSTYCKEISNFGFYLVHMASVNIGLVCFLIHLNCIILFIGCRNGILTEELECQLTTSVTSKKEEDSDSDLDID